MKLLDQLADEFITGDCFVALKGLADECVDLVLTDPPYGIDYQSNRRVARPKLPKFENDADLGWVEDWVDQIYRVLKPDRHFYCFTRFDMYPEMYAQISRRFKVKNCLIWVKNNHGSGDLNGAYAPQCEMIIFAVKGKRPLFGPRESDVLSYDNVPSAHRAHPTQKPIQLLRTLIEKSTEPGELVLDPFAGTGSTGFACLASERYPGDGHARHFLLIELDPKYRDWAVRAGLGKQEVLIETERVPMPTEPKRRSTLRTNRYRSRKEQTLALDFGS